MTFWITPHTLDVTNLRTVKAGDSVNLEFDMKRQLVDVRDVDGLLAAETKPWRTVEEFLAGRTAFDDWRRSRRRTPDRAAQ